MKIISKMLVGALAFAVTNVYAAELMTKAEFGGTSENGK